MHLLESETIQTFIQQFGYFAIFLVIALESAGLPLPGEATLISAAIYAAATHRLSLPLIIVGGVAGAILGDNLGFWIGRRFGLGLLLRHGRHIGLDAKRLRLGQYLFARHGGKIIFFGRFTALLRAFAAILAGANLYPWGAFLAFNAAGGIVWVALYASAAYLFGQSIRRIEGPIGIVLLCAAVAIGVAGWRFLRRNEARLQAEADRAIIGPLAPVVGDPS